MKKNRVKPRQNVWLEMGPIFVCQQTDCMPTDTDDQTVVDSHSYSIMPIFALFPMYACEWIFGRHLS